MIHYNGKFGHATLMTDKVDTETAKQIQTLTNHPIARGRKIVVMPDAHAGKGCVIGLTMGVGNHVIPNLVGVDIGCGVLCCKIGPGTIDFRDFHHFLKENIPSGTKIHQKSVDSRLDEAKIAEISQKISKNNPKMGITADYALRSLGTLGGGNHFIELNKDSEGNIWVSIHSGSRNFGYKIADYHQKKAEKFMRDSLQSGGYKGLEFLPIDHGGQEYLEDMCFAQQYAKENRILMAETIIEGFFAQEIVEKVESVHNYINFSDKILRKGAIQAGVGQKVVIPLNMRDGIVLGTGRGNYDWNLSAPHGAGRNMSRSEAKKKLDLDKYKRDMKGIYSECIKQSTLDESPAAYKKADDILKNINETVLIEDRLVPVFSFKDV